MSACQWTWEEQSKTYGNYGNANQWTVNAGLTSLARESCQNSADARAGKSADLVYTFITLTGDARRDFEAALGWESVLRPHLEAMTAGANGAVAAGQIRAGLEALEQSDRLVLLRIDDYGCRGLTGPEFPDAETPESAYGNFIKLCRLDLFSGKDEASGGSFGLGKAVYWRFSGLQTVLFNSVLSAEDAVEGKRLNRVFGVNQGTVHRVDGKAYQGRGYFGVPDEDGAARSTWDREDLVRRLHLLREDDRPGTSALVLAFHDPDNPVTEDETPDKVVQRLARGLREGIEESFWPLLTRGGMRVRIRHVDNGTLVNDTPVDPSETYTELVRALKRYDAGDVDQSLEKPYDVVVRPLPIDVSRRRTGDQHDQFTHQARLVVTLSDDNRDGLEDRVCLFRKPEMVVQTIDKRYEGRRYHAFVVAGVAVAPDAPTVEDRHADDFLRFAEPPAHDRWVPGRGRYQASQVNLTANYIAPWVPNLLAIEKRVHDALDELFDVIPTPDDKGPQSVLRHLRFLKSDTPGSVSAGGAPRKPVIEIVDWKVRDGSWHVEVEVEAKNRDDGWSLEPSLVLVGLDGGRQSVKWSGDLVAVEGCSTAGGRVLIPARPRARKVKARFKGTSIADLPIPADMSVVDVLTGPTGPLQTEEGA
ncbi:hypothetical protein ACI782_06780 [Geodermatophilus sp. SYSU D00703]